MRFFTLTFSQMKSAPPAFSSHATRALRSLGMPADTEGLSKLRNGDPGKVQVAALMRKRTSVSTQWIFDRLQMGNTSALSRLLGDFKKDGENTKRLEKLKKISRGRT